MIRTCGIAAALFIGLCLTGISSAADKADKAKQAKQNQMVKGTIKQVETNKGVLIVDQKLKNQVVQRELDITGDTEFVITDSKGKKEVNGKEGLALLEGKEGASVTVKCDKDVKVLKVTVMIKK